MRIFVIIISLCFSVSLIGQGLPNQFPQKNNAIGTDELYTQAGGTPYRIILDSVRMFMMSDIDLTPLSYNIDSTGSNVVDSLRGRFIIDLSGDWWYVDKDKKAVLVGGAATEGDELTTVSTITNVPDTTSLSPKAGDIFVNSDKDTMGIYGDSWVLFYGGSGGGTIDGSGTTNTVTKWSDSNTITDSQITDNGTTVEIGGVVKATNYSNSRDDSGNTTPENPWYSDGTGSLRVAPLGEFDLGSNPFGGDARLDGVIDSLYVNSGGGAGTDDQTASEVDITDSGGYYTGTEVETALQEAGADIAALPTGSGASGYLTYWDGTNSLTYDANLLYNSSTKAVGIGVAPSYLLDVRAGGTSTAMFQHTGTHGGLNIWNTNSPSVVGRSTQFRFGFGPGFFTSTDVAYQFQAVTTSGSEAKFNISYFDGPDAAGYTSRMTIDANGWTQFGTGDPSYFMDLVSTDAIRIPAGSTAQRPTNAAGVFRHNTTTGLPEAADGTNWLPLRAYSGTPSSTADSSGEEGDIMYDTSYIYIKTGSGWYRAGLSSF